jgi:pimeloyl-ACP methyl ester carboxylesterase
MATLPTIEETVTEILRIVVFEIRTRSDEHVPIQSLRIAWQNHGYNVADLPKGLQHAVSQNFLTLDKNKETLFLTAAGFERVSAESEVQSRRRQVVILVHGIRDFALWQPTLTHALEQHGFHVESINFGRMNLFAFLFPVPYFRGRALAEVAMQIRIIRQSNKDATLSVIAHSFGTFVISSLLKQFDTTFSKIIFCGSVVRYGFPFEDCQNRFEPPILNEVGARDVWPALAESVTTGYGSAGTYGFRRPLVRDRWHNGAGHSHFLDPDFCERFWVPFLKNGTIVESTDRPDKPSVWVQVISIIKVKYVGLVLLMLGCFLFYNRVSPVNHGTPPPDSPQAASTAVSAPAAQPAALAAPTQVTSSPPEADFPIAPASGKQAHPSIVTKDAKTIIAKQISKPETSRTTTSAPQIDPRIPAPNEHRSSIDEYEGDASYADAIDTKSCLYRGCSDTPEEQRLLADRLKSDCSSARADWGYALSETSSPGTINRLNAKLKGDVGMTCSGAGSNNLFAGCRLNDGRDDVYKGESEKGQYSKVVPNGVACSYILEQGVP